MKKAITFTSLALACALAHAAGGTHWQFEHLHSFSPTRDGAAPLAGLIEQEGTFWGTTSAAGPGRGAKGTVFKFVPGAQPVVMHTFRGGDGASPKSELLAIGRSLYGTVESGMLNNQGGIYRISTLGSFKVLHQLTAAEGTNPVAPLMRAADGNFYGTTVNGGAGHGSVFRMTPAGVVTVLHTAFEGGNAASKGPLVQHAVDGSLYGTTAREGVLGGGSVYSITTAGAYRLKYSFKPGLFEPGDPLGCVPVAGLTPIADGRLAGVATACGGEGGGTAFRVSAAGAVSLAHAFAAAVEGMYPEGELVLRKDDVLYGTMRFSGAVLTYFGCGSVFALTKANKVGVHHRFAEDGADGCEPRGALLSAKDGAIYGTTSRGGTFDAGTIFRLRRVSIPPGP